MAYDFRGRKNINIPFTYQSSNNFCLSSLRYNYHLDDISKEGNEISRMIELMSWVHHLSNFDSNRRIILSSMNSLEILTLLQQYDLSFNCFMYATVLNEIFLAMGLKSRFIRCLSARKNDHECHCVTIVYSKIYEKWLLFDPSFNLIYINRKGIPLSLSEFRNSLIKGEKIFAPRCDRKFINMVVQYWYKNSIIFQTYLKSEFNANASQNRRFVYLFPKDLRIQFYSVPENSYITRNPDIFYQKPD